ncbi:MAG: YdaU family protein, partial [Steroidobacteraceae bacterium]
RRQARQVARRQGPHHVESGPRMNYYEHHLGDWAAATGHLTWDEDMAYTRLLRAYYHHEQAIPDGQQYRLAKATTPTQRKAVDQVLSEFFELRDGRYHQKRADAEIARFQDKQAKAKRSAETRWHGRKQHTEGNANASTNVDTNVMRTHSEGNALQTPDTRHQTPITESLCNREESRAHAFQADPFPDPTPAAAVCMALRRYGVSAVNPGNLRLQALVKAGAQVDEFLAYVDKAKEAAPGREFPYLLAAVEGERKRASSLEGQLGQRPLSKAEAFVAANFPRLAARRLPEVIDAPVALG